MQTEAETTILSEMHAVHDHFLLARVAKFPDYASPSDIAKNYGFGWFDETNTAFYNSRGELVACYDDRTGLAVRKGPGYEPPPPPPAGEGWIPVYHPNGDVCCYQRE